MINCCRTYVFVFLHSFAGPLSLSLLHSWLYSFRLSRRSFVLIPSPSFAFPHALDAKYVIVAQVSTYAHAGPCTLMVEVVVAGMKSSSSYYAPFLKK